MGLGIPSPGTIVIADVNVHNYDGTSGIKSESQSLSTALCTEDKAILQSIADAVGGSSGVGLPLYNEEAAVASLATVAVLSYTVPVGHTFLLKHATGSGDNVGVYVISVNGTPIGKKRSYFTDFNVDFFFESDNGEGVKLSGGDVLTINLTNMGSTPADFNAGAYGRYQ